MFSFKKGQEMLLLSFKKRDNRPRRVFFHFTRHTGLEIFPFFTLHAEKFCLEDKGAAECKTDFRFERRDTGVYSSTYWSARNASYLYLPQWDDLRWNWYPFYSAEEVCLYRYLDMIPIFGRSVSELSIISNEVVQCIHTTHGHRMKSYHFKPSFTEYLRRCNSQ